MSEPIRVMVTGVGSGGHGEQILKALRLADLRCEIVGTDTSDTSSGLPLVDHPYRVPAASDPDYLPCILELCRQHGTQVLFHGSEPELKVFDRHRTEFARAGVLLPINDSRVIADCMDKSRTMAFLQAEGFEHPRSRVIRNLDDLEGIDFLPVVLKPFLGGGGSAHVHLAQTAEELRVLARYMLMLAPEFMVQEYVGTPDQEFTVGVLHSLDGERIGSIALRRSLRTTLSRRLQVPNATGRAELGPSLVVSSGVSQGELGSFPHVTGPCERIAERLGSRGPLNIQCRYFRNRVYLFEINPRYSGTTSLRAMVGFNEPELMIRRHLLGEDARPPAEIPPTFVMRGLQERIVDPARVRIPRCLGSRHEHES